ncbi:hypothetical protein [Leucobacter luti]|uniref:Uncharacterized protein n=1 Tax=Leucobacter luti TaxID=340320 RepID=A0A4Q7TY44_9MICO|nr:hypothetical protein [Leucobacter luti]MBL3698754.1 hypothetical protein [Leucobacter luti]RZT66131.1 hypothetical protein EV139_1557 [Leucobacter luti]
MTRENETKGARRARVARLVQVALASGAVLGVGASVTVAAYLDQAAISYSALGGTYDIAYADPDGNTQQGDVTPYELDVSQIPYIDEIGSAPSHRLDLVLRNAGTSDSGTVTLSLQSMLPAQPADGDGVVRDPFDVLVVSAWDADGNLLVDQADAATFGLALDSWAAGEDTVVSLELAYRTNLGTPYYFGKDVRVGFTAIGAA